jgi:hypothetical protein
MMPRGQYDRTKKAQTMTEETAPAFIREDRVAEVKQERRRRRDGDLDAGVVLRLGLPPGIEEKYPNDTLRWVNDEGNRVHFLTTRDDYDIVSEVEGRPVGTTMDGKPINAVLLRKPKEFAEADRREKLERINRQEKAVLASVDPESAWQNPDAAISRAGNLHALSENQIKGGYAP